MQINPFGFPLGAGTQPMPAFGDAGLGFAEALGVAIEGSAPPQLISLKASAAPPRNLDPKLSQTLLAQAQLDVHAQTTLAPMSTPMTGVLPGLQQSTSLSELMATAAKLPAADPMPMAEPATPGMQPATPVIETVTTTQPAATATATIVAATPEAEATPTAIEAGSDVIPPQASASVPQPAAVPAQIAPAATDPAAQPEGEALPEGETLPDASKPAQAVPTKPQKGARVRAAASEADLAQPAETKPAVPVEMLAAAVAPQQVAQPQNALREAAAQQTGNAAPAVRKIGPASAPAESAAQVASGATTADFAGVVAARGESAGSDANADGQPQPEARLAVAGKAEGAALQFPQPAQATTSADPVRAVAPAEPVIEARTGHLGQSLGVEIARKVELGEETLRIRLNPIELGRIEVTLAFDDKGSLQATVRTESAQAMDLLRQDAPDLARTLDQAGVRTDAQSFRFESRTGDGGGQQAQQQQQQNRGQFASSDDEAGAAEPIYRPVRSDGQVDLLA